MNVFQTKLVCKTLQGLESVLAEELTLLQAENIETGKRAVICNYSEELLYRANLQLRTCLKVLVPVFEFESTSPEDIYNFCSRLSWENYFAVNQSFAIDFTIQSPYFKHTQYASLKLKDAICDRFRKINGERPSINTDAPDILWNLHIFNNKVTISLDSSGTSLHKRGNRAHQNEAPLNEVLAAGMIYLSGWDRKSTFLDAMCGSGTLILEATSMALQKAPNLDREYFCFKNWPTYKETLFKTVQYELKNAVRDTIDFKIIAADSSRKSLQITEMNCRRAGVWKYIDFRENSMQKLIPPYGTGTLIINPPYGERMQSYEIDRLYKQIGDGFKQHFARYTCCLITSNIEAMKNFGLKPKKKYPLLNGKLDCLFYIYEMYEGSKRKQKTELPNENE